MTINTFFGSGQDWPGVSAGVGRTGKTFCGSEWHRSAVTIGAGEIGKNVLWNWQD